MSMRFQSLILLAAALLAFVGEARAQKQPTNALVVVGAGQDMSADLIDDVNEAIAFAVGQAESITFVPKERVRAALGYRSPREPGSCSFDDECIRKQRQALQLSRLIMVRLTFDEKHYRIHVIEVADHADGDVSMVGKSTKSSSDLINQTRRLVRKLFVAMTTLDVRSNVENATVQVDGKPVGDGNLSVRVSAGEHVIRVHQDGYMPFETSVTCVATQVCSVSVNLVKQQEEEHVVPVSMATTLRITGWSTAGVGVVMTIVGAVFGLQARDLQNELDSACQGTVCQLTESAMTNKLNEGDDAAALFNYVGVPGMVLTVGGAAMVILSYLDGFTDTPGEARIVPIVQFDGSVGVQAEWRF